MVALRRACFAVVPILVTFALLLTSCAASGPACHPVQGVVRFEQQPCAEAIVVFHSKSNQAAGSPRPIATTNELGQFKLTTFQTGDGAPAGEYAITVELRQPRQVGEEIVRDGPNVLPVRFSKPETSGLSYTVIAGDNSVSPIDLRR
jgi:hypothetical protein